MLGLINRKLRSYPIVKSSLAIGIVVLVARIAGYGEKVILAYYFGTDYRIDVYIVVSTMITSIFIFVRELIEPGFLHAFIKADKQQSRAAAWQLFFHFARVIAVLAIVLTAIGCLFPAFVLHIVAPGITAGKLDLAAGLLRIALPACFFLSLTALTNITLNSFKKFGWPALADLIYKIAILACLLVLATRAGIYAAAIGMLIASAIKLLVHVFQLRLSVMFPAGKISNDQIKTAWASIWPLLVGASFSQASVLFDNFLASFLQEGAIAAINYAKKLVDFPVSIFPYIVSTVIFPYLNEFNLNQEQHRAKQILTKSLFIIITVFLPLALFYSLFADDVVALIFKRGAFRLESVQITALPLRWYALGLPFFAMETVLVVYYFSKGNIRFPVFLGIGCTAINMLLTAVFVHYIGYTGIAIALVITKALKNVILLIKLDKSPAQISRTNQHFFWKAVAATGVFLIVILVTAYLLANFLHETFMSRLIYLALILFAGTAAYLIVLKSMNISRYFSGQVDKTLTD